MSIATLLRRAAPGSHATVRGHIRRGERIARWIEERYGISNPHAWRAKHARWVIEVATRDLSAGTRYDYWRTLRLLVDVLGHWPDWEPHLRGPWMRRGQGGRRPLLTQRGRCKS